MWLQEWQVHFLPSDDVPVKDAVGDKEGQDGKRMVVLSMMMFPILTMTVTFTRGRHYATMESLSKYPPQLK